MKNQSGGHGIFYILIPITAIILAVIINYVLDYVYQKKLDTNTMEVIEYIITKDFDNIADYYEVALQEFDKRGYTEGEDYLVIRGGHDYLVVLKSHPINDLKTFLNLFKVQWTDKNGNIDDNKIDEGMNRNTGVLSSNHIIYLNEYHEPVIEPYSEEKEKELEDKEREKYGIIDEISTNPTDNV